MREDCPMWLERLQALREWFDGWLDRIADRIEPVGERFAARNQAIDAWFKQERPPASRAMFFVLHLLFRLGKTAVLLVVFGAFFLFVVPILIILVIIVAAIVFAPVWIVYVGVWLLLGAAGVNEALRLLIVIVLTVLLFRITRRAVRKGPRR